MWTSIPTALTAVLLLSSTATALVPRVAKTSQSASAATHVAGNGNGGLATEIASQAGSTVESTMNTPGGTVQQTSQSSSTNVTTTNGEPSTNSLSTQGSFGGGSSSGGTKFLRGVNLGGWLVLEKWMTSELFGGDFKDAKDQYEFDAIKGAEEALKKHWDSYFTEQDIQELAKTGINALRIPIGYWAYDNSNTPYLKGADKYMEKAIGWARKANMKVWVDCHGSPGSQNGFDNSGHAGKVAWQEGGNMAHSIGVLKTMAKKYGSKQYADVVVGLQLTNEPISWGANDNTKTKTWAKDAYRAVKEVTENKDMVIVMHDAFLKGSAWIDTAKSVMTGGAKDFGIDTHLYQLFVEEDNKLTQKQHIEKACGWSKELKEANNVMPTFVGEWSAATNICVKSDGSTIGGTSCNDSGCQCQSAPMDKWNEKMVEQVRRFVEAQLDTFESSSSGYFIWSAKGPGGWGFMNGIKNGAIPNPVTTRKYPGQCGGGGGSKPSKRRAREILIGS